MFWLRNKKNNSLRGFEIIVCGKGSRFMRKAKIIDVEKGERSKIQSVINIKRLQI